MFHQPSRNAELRVGVEYGIIVRVDLRGDAFIARLVDQEVQVGRPEIVAFLSLQESANRAVNGDGIPGRLDGPETEASIRAGRKFSAQIHFRLLRVLRFVKADRR